METHDLTTIRYTVPYGKYQNLLSESFLYYNYIYYNWYLDIRAGGPTGYLANLLVGLNKLSESFPDTQVQTQFAVRMQRECVASGPDVGVYKKFLTHLQKNPLFNSLYMNHLSKSSRQAYFSYLSFLRDDLNQRANPAVISKIDLKRTRTIHVHEISDAVMVKNELIARGLDKKIKLILTCHTPESAAKEHYDEFLAQGYSEEKAARVLNGWKRIERAAYEAADILIYPSREAMEPAYKFLPDFGTLIQNKDVRFVATGVEAISTKLTKAEAKKKYHVDGKFVIAYIGRHNAVKGYDILKKAAEKILADNPNIVFLIGGTQGTEFKPLRHSRWIEAGRINPADFLPAADVFVLPNRQTFYDLVLLEVLSAGVPVIASHTGGNISVKGDVPELITYTNDESGLVDAIQQIYKKTPEELEKISTSLRDAYNKHFTPEQFAGRYRNTISGICNDYHFL